MAGLIINIIKFIVSRLLKVYQLKWLLKLDAWCEEQFGIDIIKQDLKFREKWPLINERIEKLEDQAHPPISLEDFKGYQDLVKRIEKIEK